MAVYLIMMAVVLILAYPLIEYKPSIGKKLCYVIVTFGIMYTISALRYGMGNDYFSYYIYFRTTREGSFSEAFHMGFEIGFSFVEKLISYFTGDIRVFYAIMAFLILVPIAYIIFKYSDNIWLSTVMFISLTFFYCSLSFIRQALAFAFIFLGYRYFKERNHFMVMLFILLGTLFHSTAVILIPMYLVAVLLKPTKIVISIYAGSVLFVYLFSWKILRLAVKIFPAYQFYLDKNFLTNGFSPIYMIVPGVIMLVALFSHFGDYGKVYPKESALFTNFAIFNFALWFISTKHFVLERFSMYPYIFMIMFIPSIVNFYKERVKIYFAEKRQIKQVLAKNPELDEDDVIKQGLDSYYLKPAYVTAIDDCTVDECFKNKKSALKKAENIPDTENTAESPRISQEEKIPDEVIISKPKKEKKGSVVKNYIKNMFIYKPDNRYKIENYHYLNDKRYKRKNIVLRITSHPVAVFSSLMAVVLVANLWYNYFGLTVGAEGFHGVNPYISLIPAYNNLAVSLENEDKLNYNLKTETDFARYLSRLYTSDKYTAIFCTKGDCGTWINEVIKDHLNLMGLDELSKLEPYYDNYMAIYKQGEVIYQKRGKQTLSETGIKIAPGLYADLKSSRQSAQIILNGTDFSLNNRGINVVVYDNENGKIVDMISIRTYHVLLTIDRERRE